MGHLIWRVYGFFARGMPATVPRRYNFGPTRRVVNPDRVPTCRYERLDVRETSLETAPIQETCEFVVSSFERRGHEGARSLTLGVSAPERDRDVDVGSERSLSSRRYTRTQCVTESMTRGIRRIRALPRIRRFLPWSLPRLRLRPDTVTHVDNVFQTRALSRKPDHGARPLSARALAVTGMHEWAGVDANPGGGCFASATTILHPPDPHNRPSERGSANEPSTS